MRLTIALLFAAGLAAAAPAAAPPHLALPYDVELDSAGRVFIADGGKHQVFRWDARHKRLVVVAGTGKRGSSGDGGPAVHARLDEIAGLAFDRSGNLYVADVHYGVVRRIDRRGIITTVAHATGSAGIAVDPTGRWLAVASIADGVYRFELATGTRESVVAVGEHGVTGPHGLAYDAAGNLLIADPGSAVLRVTPDGTVTPVPGRTAAGSCRSRAAAYWCSTATRPAAASNGSPPTGRSRRGRHRPARPPRRRRPRDPRRDPADRCRPPGRGDPRRGEQAGAVDPPRRPRREDHDARALRAGPSGAAPNVSP